MIDGCWMGLVCLLLSDKLGAVLCNGWELAEAETHHAQLTNKKAKSEKTPTLK